jgi:hypothetical protein
MLAVALAVDEAEEALRSIAALAALWSGALSQPLMQE